MKHNTWKKIAAGLLALALVTGGIPVNVGNFLTINGHAASQEHVENPESLIQGIVSNGVITLSCADTAAAGDTLTVTATLEKEQKVPVSFDWAAAAGSIGLTGTTNGTVTWDVGETGEKTFTVNVAEKGDELWEGERTFVMNVGNLKNAVLPDNAFAWSKVIFVSASDKDSMQIWYDHAEVPGSSTKQGSYGEPLTWRSNKLHTENRNMYFSTSKLIENMPADSRVRLIMTLSGSIPNNQRIYTYTDNNTFADDDEEWADFNGSSAYLYIKNPVDSKQLTLNLNSSAGKSQLIKEVKASEVKDYIGEGKSTISANLCYYFYHGNDMQHSECAVYITGRGGAFINGLPYITGIELQAMPPVTPTDVSLPAGTYYSDQIVPVTVTFDHYVTVTEEATLTINGVACHPLESEGTITQKLTFGYTVKTADSDSVNVSAISDVDGLDPGANFTGQSFGTDKNVKLVSDFTAPKAKTDLKYTGKPQELVSRLTWTNSTLGDVYYGIGKYPTVIERDSTYALAASALAEGQVYKPTDSYGVYFPIDYSLKIGNITYTSKNGVCFYLSTSGSYQFVVNESNAPITPAGCDALRIDKIEDTTITVSFVNSNDLKPTITWGAAGVLPTATDVGTYPVYYKIDGNDYFDSVAATKIADVKIGKADSLVAAPTAKNPVRENSPVQLINAGEAHTGCTIEYQLGTSATEAPAGTWTTDATQMTANSLGTYYVWYKATGDGKNYTDAAPKCLTVKVMQAQLWTIEMPDYVYDGTAHEPTIKGMTFGKLTYTYFTSAGICIGSTAPTEPGDYRVSVAASGDETHPSKLESAYYTIKGAKFAAGNTVSFKEKVEFNFLVEATDAETVEGAYVLFTYDHYGTTTTVKKAINKDDKNGKYYRVRLPLTASEMAIDIKAELYLPTLDKPVDTKTRSIKDYAEAAIKSNLDGAEVLKAMLNYGGYTQTALGNNTALLANCGEGIAVDVSAVSPKSATPFVRPVSAQGAKVTYKGSTAMTVSDVYVRHYFAVDSSMTAKELSAVKIMVGDKVLALKDLPKNNTGYYYDVAPELAYELDKENDKIVVYGFAGAETADSENAIIIENYNVIDYCEAVANSDKQTTAAKNMAKALYSYYKAAKAYVDSRA